MKKIIILVIGLMILASGAMAMKPISNWMTTNNRDIVNLTLTSTNTIFATTLEAGANAWFNVQAKGSDICHVIDASVTDAHWTIGQDQTFYDHIPIPMPKNKTLYFYVPPGGTTPATIEVMYGYY